MTLSPDLVRCLVLMAHGAEMMRQGVEGLLATVPEDVLREAGIEVGVDKPASPGNSGNEPAECQHKNAARVTRSRVNPANDVFLCSDCDAQFEGPRRSK